MRCDAVEKGVPARLPKRTKKRIKIKAPPPLDRADPCHAILRVILLLLTIYPLLLLLLLEEESYKPTGWLVWFVVGRGCPVISEDLAPRKQNKEISFLRSTGCLFLYVYARMQRCLANLLRSRVKSWSWS